MAVRLKDKNMFEIFLLAALAGFVFMRLHSVLGQRTGHEKPRRTFLDNDAGEDIVTLPEHRVKRQAQKSGKKAPSPAVPADHPCAEALNGIVAADSRFTLESFLTGARKAFEEVMTAFAAGKKDTLKKLLAPELFKTFAGSVNLRQEKGEVLTLNILGFDDVQVERVVVDKRKAWITVRYDTQQKVALGQPDKQDMQEKTENVIDVWTFSRDLGSSNPNWTLVSTQGG